MNREQMTDMLLDMLNGVNKIEDFDAMDAFEAICQTFIEYGEDAEEMICAVETQHDVIINKKRALFRL